MKMFLLLFSLLTLGMGFVTATLPEPDKPDCAMRCVMGGLSVMAMAAPLISLDSLKEYAGAYFEKYPDADAFWASTDGNFFHDGDKAAAEDHVKSENQRRGDARVLLHYIKRHTEKEEEPAPEKTKPNGKDKKTRPDGANAGEEAQGKNANQEGGANGNANANPQD